MSVKHRLSANQRVKENQTICPAHIRVPCIPGARWGDAGIRAGVVGLWWEYKCSSLSLMESSPNPVWTDDDVLALRYITGGEWHQNKGRGIGRVHKYTCEDLFIHLNYMPFIWEM